MKQPVMVPIMLRAEIIVPDVLEATLMNSILIVPDVL